MKTKYLALALAVLMMASVFSPVLLAVSAEDNVATLKIGEADPVGYTSLSAALTAAKSEADGTKEVLVTMLKDCTSADNTWVQGDKITLDGNNHTLTYTGNDYALCSGGSNPNEGDPTVQAVKNLKVVAASGGGLKVYYNATLTMENVDGTGVTGNCFWLVAREKTHLIFNGNYSETAFLNDAEKTEFSLVINGGTFAKAQTLKNVTINGGTFNGDIRLKGSSATIAGGTFNGEILVKANTVLTANNASIDKITLEENASATVTNTVFNFHGGRTPVDLYSNTTLTLGEGVVIKPKSGMIGTQIIRFNKTPATVNVSGGVYTGNGGFIFGAISGADANGDNHVVVNVSGGTFTNPAYVISSMKGAELNISGGSFTTSTTDMFWMAENSKLTITGGTFNATNGAVINSAQNVKTTISGGTFVGTKSTSLIDICAGNITLNISGGSFKHTAGANGRSIQSSTATPNTIVISGGLFDLGSEYMINVNGPHTVTVTGGYFIANQYRYETSSNKTAAPVRPLFFFNETNNTDSLGATFTASGFVYECRGNVKFAEIAKAQGKASSTMSISNGTYYNQNGNQTASQNGFPGLPATREGGSIRLVENGNGLRFTSKISKAVIDAAKAKADTDTEVSYGTIIAPTDYLQGLILTKNTLDILGASYKEIPATAAGSETDESGNVTLRAALINIQEGNLNRKFSAVAYVKYVENGKTVYLFGDYNAEKNSRSIAEVAAAALADIKTAADSYYTNPVTGGFSRYNDAQRSVLAGFAAALNG